MPQDISNRWILLLVLFIALIFAVVGFGTPNWYRAVLSNTLSFTAGYFDVCVSSTCYSYIDYLKLTRYSDDYIGCIVFHVLGIVLTVLAVLLILCVVFKCEDDCVGPQCYSIHRRLMYVGWLSLLGGICLLVTVIWFYVAIIRDGFGRGNLAGTFDLQADYSLGLTAAACAILILVAFFIFFLKHHLFFDDPYQQRPKIMLEPAHRPAPYRIEQPAPTYAIERPTPVRISKSIRPPSPKTYRYTTREEPEYFSRASYVDRRY